MRSCFTLATLLVGLLPGAIAGQTAAQDTARKPAPEVAAAIAALPAATVKRLRSAPDRFLQEAGRLIYGYGADGAIDAAGLARYVALQRASVRARSMRSFLDADLNNDGAVSSDEITARADTLAANARGRLIFAHKAADLENDTTVSAEEMRNLAELDAMDSLTADEEQVILGFIGFDADKDGLVTTAEVQTLIRLIQPEL